GPVMASLRTRFVAPFVFFLVLGSLPGRAAAEEVAASKIYQQTLRSVAWVVVPLPGDGTSMGSGWLVDRAHKVLITNHHVVENQDAVQVFFPTYKDGKPFTAPDYYLKHVTPVRGKVIDTDIARDLAAIELESLPPEVAELKLAADSAAPGDRVHSIGN